MIPSLLFHWCEDALYCLLILLVFAMLAKMLLMVAMVVLL